MNKLKASTAIAELLDVVDGRDNIIASEMRHVIHKKGLRHREVHVFFFTNQGVIFQHRAKNKDAFPDMLDATVGGHVDAGESYRDSSLREVQEEVGKKLTHEDLFPLGKIQQDAFDSVTGMQNNVFRFIYAYHFDGSVHDLSVEEHSSQGFVLIKWDEIFTDEHQDLGIISDLLSEEYISFYGRMKNIIDINKWNDDKKFIDCCAKHKNVKRGEVWWIKTGQNIGFEQNGGRNFRRPAVVLKRISFMLAVIVPITSKNKNMKSRFYMKLPSLIDGIVLLTQIRVISTKRMLRKKFKLPENEMNTLLKSVENFLFGISP